MEHLYREERERQARGKPEPEEVRFWREAFARIGSPPASNPVHVLNLATGATIDEVKARHREMVKRHHPDRGGDPMKFRKIQADYKQIVADLEQSAAR